MPLRPVFRRSEIRISLRTSDRRTAVLEARKWKVRYEEWFGTIANMKLPPPKLINTYPTYALWGIWFEVPTSSGRAATQKYVKLPPGRDVSAYDLELNDDGSVRATEIATSPKHDAVAFNVKVNLDGSVHVEDLPNDLSGIDVSELGDAVADIAKKILKVMPTQPLAPNVPVAPSSKISNGTTASNLEKADLRMSTVLEKYKKEKLVGKRWNAKTEQQNMSRLRLVCVYLNDPDINIIRPLDITSMKQDLHYLPVNLPIDGLSNGDLCAVIEQQKERERTGRPLAKTISITTLNAYLSKLSGFMDWCTDQGYTSSNPADKKTIRQNKNRDDDGDDSRVEWEHSDLKAIFESRYYSEHMYAHAYQYWLPVLAIFTGARINELSQLHTDDIVFDTESNAWCIKIFPDIKSGQKVKNMRAKRLIPLHQTVINLGFIEFLQTRRKEAPAKSIQLFTGLSHQRDGYGKNASRWFNESFKRYHGYKPNDGKVFHSFRRNVITQLKNSLLKSDFGKQIHNKDIITKAIVGHKGDIDITWDYYAGDFRPSVLKIVIDHLSWPVTFSPYREPDNQARKRLRAWLREIESPASKSTRK